MESAGRYARTVSIEHGPQRKSQADQSIEPCEIALRVSGSTLHFIPLVQWSTT